MKNRLTSRVSIVALMDIKKGTKITNKMIDIRRPGTGIQPIDFWKVIGKKTTKSIEEEEPLKWDFLE